MSPWRWPYFVGGAADGQRGPEKDVAHRHWVQPVFPEGGVDLYDTRIHVSYDTVPYHLEIVGFRGLRAIEVWVADDDAGGWPAIFWSRLLEAAEAGTRVGSEA